MNKRALLLICISVLALLCLVSCGDEEKTVEVKFQTYIDSVSIPSANVKPDSTVACPDASMERDGYKFAGWYFGNKKWDFERDTVTKDMTLSAKWESYLSYTEAEDGLWVVGCDFDAERVVIPREYNGKKITGIHWAFANRSKIKTLVIPSTVTYISANSFNGCYALEEIIIPEGVLVIEKGAFASCPRLKAIYCEAQEMPSGWDKSFNETDAQVILSYKNR